MDQSTYVVADEVHLVDDRHHRPTLGVTLAELRRLNTNLRIVALSTTVGNAGVVSDWLDAELVKSDWRPIDLKMDVHHDNVVSFVDGGQREVSVNRRERQTPVLVVDVLEGDGEGDRGSSLVFVSSRRNAGFTARRMADMTERHVTGDERGDLAEFAAEICDVSDTETSDDLVNVVARGAAFHHAELAAEHRTLVEDAFRDKLVKCIYATPTLTAGVSTLSRRVVVRDWQRHDGDYGDIEPLSMLEVHQMMGRADRPGLGPYGEAMLLTKDANAHDELFEWHIWANAEDIRPKPAAESALQTRLLATVVSGLAHTREGLLEFLDQTLYATQTDDPERLGQMTNRVLDYLEVNEFVESEGETMQAMPVGHTVSRPYLDPMSAVEIIDGLKWTADHRTGEPRALVGEMPEKPT